MLASRAGISQAAKAVRTLPKSNIVKLAARMESNGSEKSIKKAAEEVSHFGASDRFILNEVRRGMDKIEARMDRFDNKFDAITTGMSALEVKTTEKIAGAQYKIILAAAGLVGFAYIAIDKRLDEIRNDIKELHKGNSVQPTTNTPENSSDQKKNSSWWSRFSSQSSK